VVNGNLQAWARKGYENGPLRYPTTGEGGLPDGRGIAQWFQGGAIYWSAPTHSHSVVNGNMKAWATQNYENGPLRYPTTDEAGLPDGRGIVQWFQGGAIYWSAASGSRPVLGDNLGAWSSVGYENGSLGYPVSSEATLPDGQGTAQWFQGGAIYRSPDTGAHALPRSLLQAWIDRGAENGALGYPVSDPYAVSGGTRIDFEHGSLLRSADGTVTSSAAPMAARAAPAPVSPTTPEAPEDAPPTDALSSTEPTAGPAAKDAGPADEPSPDEDTAEPTAIEAPETDTPAASASPSAAGP
jgi:uncharacterized protein with LGFP repeats